MELYDTVRGIVFGGADKELLHNNANKASERIPVQKNMVAGEVAKSMAKELLPKHVIEAHNNFQIHFHDIDENPLFPFFNCSLIDVGNMLEHGFKMGNADIEQPKSIAVACAVTAQIIAQVACHQYGGVSIDRIDEVLAPYVTKSYNKHLSTGNQWLTHDKAVVYATEMTAKEVKAACKSLEYEVNTLFTSQGQSPFITFGFGLGTSWQSRLIQKNILEVRLRGLGKQGRTAIFPKLVYMMDEGINEKPTDPNYDIKQLAIRCAGKRNYPDILHMGRLRESGGGATPMGCRSFLHRWEDENGKEVWAGRNNLGVVSVNLPRIAIESDYNVDKFFSILDERLNICLDSLNARIDRLRGVKAKVAPILYCEGALGFRLDPEDEIMQVFENHRASISLGYIGINEATNAMFKDTTHIFESKEKQAFGLSVVKYLKDTTNRWDKETGWAFGVYSTPSESLCSRFCSGDLKEFGNISGVTDKGFYTNSFHLDVNKQVNPLEKIMFEAPYHKYATGGHITFTEVPNISPKQQEKKDILIETIWDNACRYVPYFGVNCVIDYCHKCNSGGDAKPSEDGFVCEFCGNNDPNTLEVTKRVCGYLGSPNSRPFNDGKQKEVILRVKHI